MEKILFDFAERITSGFPKSQAKTLLKETVKKLAAFNERTDFIETEERQELLRLSVKFYKPEVVRRVRGAVIGNGFLKSYVLFNWRI